jgi:hypothetical protein
MMRKTCTGYSPEHERERQLRVRLSSGYAGAGELRKSKGVGGTAKGPQNCEKPGLNLGVVVGPGFFEAVGELFYRLNTLCIPHEESRRCRAQTTNEPKYLLHETAPFSL